MWQWSSCCIVRSAMDCSEYCSVGDHGYAPVNTVLESPHIRGLGWGHTSSLERLYHVSIGDTSNIKDQVTFHCGCPKLPSVAERLCSHDPGSCFHLWSSIETGRDWVGLAWMIVLIWNIISEASTCSIDKSRVVGDITGCHVPVSGHDSSAPGSAVVNGLCHGSLLSSPCFSQAAHSSSLIGHLITGTSQWRTGGGVQCNSNSLFNCSGNTYTLHLKPSMGYKRRNKITNNSKKSNDLSRNQKQSSPNHSFQCLHVPYEDKMN